MIKGMPIESFENTMSNTNFGFDLNPITGGTQAPALGGLPTGGFKPSKVLTTIPTDSVIVGVAPNEPTQTTGSGGSLVVEPPIFTPLPIKGVPIFELDNPQGGIPINNGNAVAEIPLKNTGGVVESDVVESGVAVLEPTKKKFPYWIIAVAVVGGYFVFRKK